MASRRYVARERLAVRAFARLRHGIRVYDGDARLLMI